MSNLYDPIIIEADRPGPTLLILGGVHGNETCGVRLIDFLKDTSIERGKLILAYGNPRAIEQRKRLTEENLNRIFLPDDRLSAAQRTSYEYQRSHQLLPLLDQADVLLDVHSSNTAASTPFVIAEDSAAPAATLLPVSIRCSGFDQIHPGSTDGYMNRNSRIGICIECGTNTAADAFERARDSALSLMAYLGLLSRSSASESFPAQTVFQAYDIYRTRTDDFRLEQDFADFATLQKGAVIGYDGDSPVYSELDQHIIFARPRLTRSGQDAFVLLSQQFPSI